MNSYINYITFNGRIQGFLSKKRLNAINNTILVIISNNHLSSMLDNHGILMVQNEYLLVTTQRKDVDNGLAGNIFGENLHI